MRKWLPIRKVAVAGVGGLLTWGAMRTGLDLGSAGANEIATLAVGLVFAFAEKDPKVAHTLDEAQAILDSYGTGVKPPGA